MTTYEKWSAFTAGTTIAGSDITVGLQGGANVQWTMTQLKTWTSASPTLVTPTLGVATATSINKMAITAPATSSTLAVADGKTFTASNTLTLAGTDGKTLSVSNSLTLAGTDSTTMTFPATSTTVAGLGIAQSFSQLQTFSAGASIASGQTLDWNSDAILLREAANTLAMRNGTSQQTLRVYTSYTDASNYTRLSITSSDASNTTFNWEKAGSGSWNAVTFTVGGNQFLQFNYSLNGVFLGRNTYVQGGGEFGNSSDTNKCPGAVYTSGPVAAQNFTAIPAGGTAGAGFRFSSTANFGVFFGSGAPTLSAAKGSLYLRSDGSGVNDRMYVNTNGSTTWTAVVTVA